MLETLRKDGLDGQASMAKKAFSPVHARSPIIVKPSMDCSACRRSVRSVKGHYAQVTQAYVWHIPYVVKLQQLQHVLSQTEQSARRS